MKAPLNRRNFLKSAGLSVAGVGLLAAPGARAVEPVNRTGKPRLGLSLAAYSFRVTFKANNPAKPFTLLDFVDYCADHNLAGAEITSYYFPDPVTDEFILRLKHRAFVRGIPISGSAVGNNFVLPKGPKRDEQIAMVKKWIDRCSLLGAPHIRVFAGPVNKEFAMPDAKKLVIEALEECGAHAATKGIFLGLENHGGIVAEPQDLLDIVRAVKSPWVGINLDTGNFQTDDPYTDLAKCAPYAVNVQYKVEIHRRGEKLKEIADLPRVIKILRDANYQGYVALEHEAKEDPWQTVPGWLEILRPAMAA
ncbi:MAG: sugar phosphate isomerase/epimerase [Pedosphaera sp.]|nr:sugar phosphate isomerase/epimerase [Pedosphaera sp.]